MYTKQVHRKCVLCILSKQTQQIEKTPIENLVRKISPIHYSSQRLSHVIQCVISDGIATLSYRSNNNT